MENGRGRVKFSCNFGLFFLGRIMMRRESRRTFYICVSGGFFVFLKDEGVFLQKALTFRFSCDILLSDDCNNKKGKRKK